MPQIPLHLFEVTKKYPEEPDIVLSRLEKSGREHAIVCKLCGYRITSESAKIMVNNSHVHTCTNPAGIIYTFGCFQDAPGITATGTASSEYTWFTGYSWQILVCSNCNEHLGWLFRNGDIFFALIVDKLTFYST